VELRRPDAEVKGGKGRGGGPVRHTSRWRKEGGGSGPTRVLKQGPGGV
jgi:hypothetical protein